MRRFGYYFVSLTTIMLVTALVVACSSGPPVRIGENVSTVYATPVDYQAHRNQQRFFDTPQGRIAYTDHGEGKVLVLIHGVPTSSWMYRKIIPDLADTFRVISVDLMGYGSSDKPADTGDVYTNAMQARRVGALLESLNISNFGVLMHDMGGLVAWELLKAQPDAVSDLIVLNTIVNQEGFNHPRINPGGFTRQLMRAYTSDLTSAVILKKTFDDLGLVDEFALSEAECFGYVKPMREGSDSALYAFFTHLNADLFHELDTNRARFKGFPGRTLVIWGGQDETLTTRQIPILQDMLSIPDENIHIYPENGHFLAEEIPDEIVTKVKAFIGAG